MIDLTNQASGSSSPADPLSPQVFSILLALGDGHRHGYGIMKELEERTGGRVTLLPGSLYSTIRRMLKEGWIEETDDVDPEGDARRRYYALTENGRQVAGAEVERMVALLGLAAEKKVLPPHLAGMQLTLAENPGG